MVEHNKQQSMAFISTDNNQLKFIMEEKITFIIAKKIYGNKFNKKHSKSTQGKHKFLK